MTLLDYLEVMKYPLVVGVLLAAVAGLLSVFVVLRRMAMISEAVAHAGIGGLALSLLLGYWWPLAGEYLGQQVITGLFCVATALLIGRLARGREVTIDSSIGIFLVATVSLGIVMLFARAELDQNSMPLSWETVLFGSIVAVGGADAVVLAVLAPVIFAVVLFMLPSFMYASMDEEMARVGGVKVRLVNLLLLIMVSALVTLAARMVGMLMINALMILPGATARMLSRRFDGMLRASLLVGVLGVAASLMGYTALAWAAQDAPHLAWLGHIPSGPVMVLTLFVIFLVVYLFHRRNRPQITQISQKESDAAADASK